MKELTWLNLRSNWNAIKMIKLLLAVVIFFQALESGQWLLGLFSLFFFGQALLNIGCCGTEACGIPGTKKRTNTRENNHITKIKQ